MRDLAHTARFIPKRKKYNTGTKINPYRKSKISQHGIAFCVSGWCAINHHETTLDIVWFKNTDLSRVHQWEQKWQIQRASPIEMYWNDESWKSPLPAIAYKPSFHLRELVYQTPWEHKIYERKMSWTYQIQQCISLPFLVSISVQHYHPRRMHNFRPE